MRDRFQKSRGMRRRPAVEGLEPRSLLSLAGVLDPAFGVGGSTTVNLTATPGPYLTSQVEAVAVQADGKTVEAGNLITNAGTLGAIAETSVVTGLDANGSVDTTFGTAGFVTPFPGGLMGYSSASAVLGLPDGKILAAGSLVPVTNGSGLQQFFTRLNPDGSVDTTFGTGGMVSFADPGVNVRSISQLAMAPDGQIVLEANVEGSSNYVIARLDADGMLDTSFGTGGFANSAVEFGTVTVGADSKVVLCSNYGAGQVEQLDADGSPDTSFGVGGVVTLPLDDALGPIVSEAFGNAAVQPDGKILVAGSALIETGPASDPASVDSAQAIVARLNLDGSLDTTFGGTGEILAGKPSSSFANAVLATQPDGKILVGGPDLSVIRLEPDGSPDDGFGAGSESAGTSQEYDDGSPTDEVFVLPDGNVEVAVGKTITQFFGQTVTGDYDNIGKSDPAVYLPNLGVFAYRPSSGGADVVIPFGVPGAGQTLPTPGDYSGTGQTEVAAYLPSLGEFAIRPSSGPDEIVPFGIAGARQTIPAPGDYDGSGKTEIAAYLPSLGEFVYRPAGGGADVAIPFGFTGAGQTIPASGDYDGLGKTNIAAYLPSLGAFAIRPSSGPDQIVPFGIAGAGQSIPEPGDYDGSGKTELAVYIPSQGLLAYRPANGGPDVLLPFGAPGSGQTLPAPGDYSGSGKTELAAYIPSQGIFAYRPSGGRPDFVTPFGVPGPGQTIPFDTIDAAAASITPTVSAASVDVLPEVALKKARTNQVSATVIS